MFFVAKTFFLIFLIFFFHFFEFLSQMTGFIELQKSNVKIFFYSIKIRINFM